MPGEPGPMMMIMHLVPVADAVLLDPPMTAQVEHGGKLLPLPALLRRIEVARHVKARARLVVELLHDEALPFQFAGDGRLQFGAGTGWNQAEHIAQIFPVSLLEPDPVLLVRDLNEEGILDFGSPEFEVLSEHVVPSVPQSRGMRALETKQAEQDRFAHTACEGRTHGGNLTPRPSPPRRRREARNWR